MDENDYLRLKTIENLEAATQSAKSHTKLMEQSAKIEKLRIVLAVVEVTAIVSITIKLWMN